MPDPVSDDVIQQILYSASLLRRLVFLSLGSLLLYAIQNMWLMSRAMNIGLGWVSILHPASVNKILRAPEQNKLVGYLCIGYVKKFFTQPELEKLQWDTKKDIHSVVYRNQYASNVD